MICLNPKNNSKLLQTFNNDPYYDICIRTATKELNLVLSYLSIDSEFFNQIQPSQQPVDLSELNENCLIRVLRSLYGQPLWAVTIQDLRELYLVVQKLQVKEYISNARDCIKQNEGLMDNLQLVQFCFNYCILHQEIRQRHYRLKLAVFANTRNYLQLNKISQSTLSSLLTEYSEQRGEEADSTINSIIQNYIGRNNLRPHQFFSNYINEPLRRIWEKFHHSISYLISTHEKIKQSQLLNNEQNTKKSLIASPSNSQNIIMVGSGLNLATHLMRTSSIMPNMASFQNESQQKDEEIKDLEKKVELNNEIILTLKKQIEDAKIILDEHRRVNLVDDSLQREQALMRRKEFIGIVGLKNVEPEVNSNQNQRKVINEEIKETKTMNKLNKGKRIFQ